MKPLTALDGWVKQNENKITSTIVGLVVMLILVITILVYNFYSDARKLKENEELLGTINKAMVTYKDKYGRQVALTEVIRTENINNIIKIKSSDSIITQLQVILRENKTRLQNGGSATVISSQGSVNKKTPTITLIPTKPKESEVDKVVFEENEFPEYSTSFKDKWINYDILATSDSINLKLKYRDEYSVVIGEEKDMSLGPFKRLFSKKKNYAWVTSASPYNEIKSTKTTYITPKEKSKFSVGIQAGYGFTPGTNVTNPYIGIGVSYRLFNLPKF